MELLLDTELLLDLLNEGLLLVVQVGFWGQSNLLLLLDPVKEVFWEYRFPAQTVPLISIDM